MHKSVLFVFGFVALAAFALVPHEAMAVKISPQQRAGFGNLHRAISGASA